MKLISSPASPYARKVRVVLHETGLIDAVEEHNVATSPMDTNADLKAVNPLGRLPALIGDDGRAIYDSRVITRFLDARAGTSLYPQDNIWQVLTLEATGEGMLDSLLLMVYEGRARPPEQQSKDWVEAQWAKASRGIAALNDDWIDLLSGPVTGGHVAAGCALGYADFRHAGRDWRSANPALADWFATFSQRPSMVATAPADL